MPQPTCWESMKVGSGELLSRVNQLVREGTVRRVVIKQRDRSIAEFPLAVGVVGALAAPALAAIGALTALLTECSIDVERVGSAPAASAEPPEPSRPTRKAARRKRK